MEENGAVGAHLVGSVPLPDAETVFRTAAEHLGTRLRRAPDGETGDRLGWIIWQLQMLMEHPQLEVLPPDPERYAPNPKVRRKPNVAAEQLTFDDLGYAREAKSSWAVFSTLQQAGVLPEHWRFQVCLPTPLAPVFAFIDEPEQADTEVAYEAAMRREVDEITTAIPHDRLALQWDTAVEFGMLERLFPPYFDDTEQGILDRLTRYASWVPHDVELGFHLCYGDAEHQHFKEPDDAAILVRVANSLTSSVEHPLQWIHMPVPRGRDDDAYYAPLADLSLDPDTQLFLGLAHLTDGVHGTRRRIDAARRVVDDFGVATECGMGRRPPETVVPLMEIHAAVSAPVAGDRRSASSPSL